MFFCKKAKENFCENHIGIGTNLDGAFAEYMVVREKQAFKFSQELSFVDAAMAEPLSCCLHGIDLCNIKQGDEVLIIGGGPIGLLMLQLAKIAGASKLIVSEPVEEKRNLALKLGADRVVNHLEEDLEGIINEKCKNL